MENYEEEILYYPVTLIWKLSVGASDVLLLNNFFDTTKIKEKNYNLIVWVEGKESENRHQVIPIGKLVQMSIGIGNTYEIHKNIEGVFDFDLTDANFNEERGKIIDWFMKYKINNNNK